MFSRLFHFVICNTANVMLLSTLARRSHDGRAEKNIRHQPYARRKQRCLVKPTVDRVVFSNYMYRDNNATQHNATLKPSIKKTPTPSISPKPKQHLTSSQNSPIPHPSPSTSAADTASSSDRNTSPRRAHPASSN